MTDVNTAIEAVSALIGERTKFEGWIATLDAKTDVPKHVLEKVRNDYTGRLSAVLKGFSAHVPALETALASIKSRDGALALQEQSSRDEHAEGELRHMVGELDNDQWEQVRIGHEATLKRLETDRAALATELEAVQRSLAAATDAGQRTRTMSGPAAAAPAAAPEPVAPAAPAPVAPPEAAAPAAPVTVVTPIAPSPVPERAAAGDDLGFLRGGSSRAESPSSFTPPASGAEASRLSLVTDDTARAVATPPSSAASGTAAKTLRCGECATMNYATEWYCERCGGELAVL